MQSPKADKALVTDLFRDSYMNNRMLTELDDQAEGVATTGKPASQ